MLLARFLGDIVRAGRLTIIDATGRTHVVGGEEEGPAVTVRLHDRALHGKLWRNISLHAGEAYMDGTLTVEEGTLYDLLDLFGRNVRRLDNHSLLRLNKNWGHLFRGLTTHNPIARARRNAAHHYDLSGALYDLFLDKDRQYSCAYFTTDNDSLEVAQDNKKRHIAAKLLLKPEARILDIGCGWGGLALYLARVAEGATVTGLTLSKEQHAVAEQRAAEAGLDDRVAFHIRDYREEFDPYDRIVSVGMFEHVGPQHYGQFFGKVKELLAEDGVCLLHSIGRMEPPGSTNPWLRKYIFPGGYTPALSEVIRVVERVGLWITDIEILRLHYAETLREWRRRFEASRDKAKALYNERFCRMWEFYLAGCEISFRYMNQMVFQMQLARRQDAVPLTRDYIAEWEQAHIGTGDLAH